MSAKHWSIRWNNPLKLRIRSRGRSTRRGYRLSPRVILRTLLGFMTVGLLTTAFLFAWYARDLPTPGKIVDRQPSQATQIFDREGHALYAVFDEEKRISIPDKDIPTVVKQATIAIEDKHFYDHHGFDLGGIVRGTILKPLSGERAQGGSTITQQYVKNALLSPDRTVDRKIRELILSVELEFLFSKAEILELYLNEIPYGSNAYGIEAAAQTYFGKPARELSLPEAAVLAALPQRPTYLSPYGNNLEELLHRKNLVLQSMEELGFVTPQERVAAEAVELVFLPRREQIQAPHFVFYIRDQLVKTYGEDLVLRGGLKVTTTLDSEAQRAAEAAVTKAAQGQLARFGASNAALSALDPTTGQILAMVGSVDYFDTDNDGNFNVTTAARQPGSSFKPIVYATGLKEGWFPAATLWDVETDFGNYTPQNFNGQVRGPVTIRQALAQSLNIPAVKMLSLVGLKDALETAEDLGITTLTEPDRYGLALVLGGGEVRPLELAGAYSVFANGGTRLPMSSILKVEDRNGRILEEWKAQPDQVIAPEVAYQITSILSDNDARSPVFGSRSALYFPTRPVAAKTGTTQENRDAWIVGYTPSITVSVWAGNNDNSPMSARAGGESVAGPIFRDFLNAFYDGRPSEEFGRPAGLESIAVDALSSKLPTEHSPQTITDLFAAWQKPTEEDDVHTVIRINKLNGKLASDLTPVALVEEKVFLRLHSEKPDDPRFEEPVLAWAREHGYELSEPPTDIDDTRPDQLPTISLTAPANGSVQVGTLTFVAEPTAPAGMRSVEFFVDGVMVGSVEAAPWQFAYDISQLATGNHEIGVRVTDVNGVSAENGALIIVARDETPPGPVVNPSARSGETGSGTVILHWGNPADGDLASMRIYRSANPNQDSIGTLVKEVKAIPSAVQTETIKGHSLGGIYYFTFRPVDQFGNESTSTNQISVLVL